MSFRLFSRDHGPGGGGGGRGGRGGGGLGLGGWTVLNADLRTGGRSTRYSSNSLQLVQLIQLVGERWGF